MQSASTTLTVRRVRIHAPGTHGTAGVWPAVQVTAACVRLACTHHRAVLLTQLQGIVTCDDAWAPQQLSLAVDQLSTCIRWSFTLTLTLALTQPWPCP